MKINFRTISTFILYLLLLGCSHVKPDNTQAVDIAAGVRFKLLSPATLGISKVLTQSVTVKYTGEEHKFIAQIEIEANSLVFVAMTPLGQHLFSIKYQDKNWHYEIDPILQNRIKPEYLLADFQLSYWAIELLQQQLYGGTIQLEAAKQRAIYRQGKKIIDIRYGKSDLWTGTVEFRHLERNYSVLVETLAVEEL